jgi:hypothetical protein
MTAWTEEESSKRMLSEKLIAQIDYSSAVKESFKVSSDNRHVAWVVIIRIGVRSIMFDFG